MGRVKLKIKRLENTNGRQATYAKRKNGIMKKANELAILCDTDILLLMFSPTGKPSLCNGKHSSMEEVIAKFSQLTPQERAKRKLESLEALKKTFKKLDHDVNIQDFLGTRSQKSEDLTNQTRVLQTQLSEIHNRLSYWPNPEKINSIEHLEQMEGSLRESLNRIRTCKENLGKQQLMSLDSNCQFHNEMHIPFGKGVDQQFQTLSSAGNNGSQHIPENPDFFSPRHMDCPASSSFGSYFAHFGASTNLEIDSSRQESGLLNELSGATSLRLQTGGQYPYLPYNLNSLSNTKFQPVTEIGMQENLSDCHADRSFEAPQPGFESFDTTHVSWASTSRPCTVAVFDEHLYPEQPK